MTAKDFPVIYDFLTKGKENRRFEEYGSETEARILYPRGLTKADLNIDLPECDDIVAVVAEKCHPLNEYFEQSYRTQLTREFLTDPKTKDHLTNWMMAHFCTPGELCRFFAEVGGYYRSESLKSVPQLAVFWKIRNSAWRFRMKEMEWKDMAAYYRFFQDFEFGDFEVTLDMTTGCNTRSGGALTRKYHPYSETYIDGTFGLFIWHKGKHVLTISVSPTHAGLIINQVQLKEKKGNRWLYQLPRHYFDFAVECVYEAAEKHGIQVMLISGKHAAERVASGYEKVGLPEGWHEEIAPRITRLYSQKLTNLRRKPGLMRFFDKNLVYRLERKSSQRNLVNIMEACFTKSPTSPRTSSSGRILTLSTTS